ncbi:MAG: elongation factor EF-2 [archaeon]
MGRKEEMVKKASELMNFPERIRNIGICAHVDHGKTTLTDNLIAGAGLMSEELAGKAVVMDSYILESQRGITIFAGNISLVYNYENQDYLINLIDTPGHVDFGGQVTRALRAIDGAIVVVCAVEGVMPQTETVLREALKEKVKPVLFINKVDRLINELQITPEEMQNRFTKIITKVNGIIKKYAPEEFKDSWQVSVQNGTVCFGSAYNNWAISWPYLQKTKITFKDIYNACKENKQKDLAKKIPLDKVLLDMIVSKLPTPTDAQKIRLSRIWKGDINSEIGKQMYNCDSKGKLAIMITGIKIDPHVGEIAIGRVLSGIAEKGKKVILIGMGKEVTIQQVGIYMNKTDLFTVEKVPAGNIAGIIGLKDARAGETACEEIIVPFEEIKHYSEPVITESVEPQNPGDLPKLIDTLINLTKEDPTVHVEINKETGEHLISGMGEVHLETINFQISHDKKIPIKTSPPIVVYRESVSKKSDPIESKSPNKHNKFYIYVEPLEDGVYELLAKGEIKEGKVKDAKLIADKLKEKGMDYEQAKRVWAIQNKCVLVDMTRGIQYLNEAKELIIQGFLEAVEAGPLAKEKVLKIKVVLSDALLHEDAVHRGPAQVIPTIKRGIHASILLANPILLEPKQKLYITTPQEYIGDVSTNIQNRRGIILDVSQDEDLATLEAKVPVAEMFGFAASIRSVTHGRALWSTEYHGYEKLPKELQDQTIKQIRKRKGLSDEIPNPLELLEK